jgi:DNA-binding LytR/AlgR family response regulator
MLIKLIEDLAQKDIEVLIKFARKNRTVNRLISLITSVDREIKCTSEQNDQTWIKAMDIYYFESIDKKTFVYCEKLVYRTEYRLYELLQQLSDSGFVQISKSCIVNINALESIKSLPNSRIEATLSNGERINITRKYITDIKVKLEER